MVETDFVMFEVGDFIKDSHRLSKCLASIVHCKVLCEFADTVVISRSPQFGAWGRG